MLLCLGAVNGVSQAKTYVGVKVGGHAGSVYMEHTIFNFNAELVLSSGLHAGLMVRYFPNKRRTSFQDGIQAGVYYVQKRWRQTFPDTGLPDYNTTMSYLEIPIEGVGYFGRKNKYFIAGGIYMEFLIDVNKDHAPAVPEGVDFATYEKGRDRKIGYGGRLSGGVFRDFTFGSLHLEAFFTYSLSNFIDAGDLTNDQLPDISNLWNIGISVGYFISFGK